MFLVLPKWWERMEMYRCGSRGQNEEGKQLVQGKTGLLDEIGELRVVHPTCGEDLGSRRFYLYLLQVSKEGEVWTKD